MLENRVGLAVLEKPSAFRTPLRVAVFNPTGLPCPELAAFHPRRVEQPAAVRPSDRVVVLAGNRMAGVIATLSGTLGRFLPPVLVIAPELDEHDILAAFQHGATSYVVLGRSGCSLAAAVRHTADRESFVPPAVATTLLGRRARSVGSMPGTVAGSPTREIRATLSPREQEIMALLAAGYLVTEIADRLALTGKTVRNNLSNIYAKLQVRRQSEAVLRWLGPPAGAAAGEPDEIPRLAG